jgi:hypothetical protein
MRLTDHNTAIRPSAAPPVILSAAKDLASNVEAMLTSENGFGMRS